jgi:serine protease AprX
LQANPTLTPNLVKVLLMYTAQPLAGFNMLEQGSGQLNIAGAIQLASLVRRDLTSDTPLGSPLLTVSEVPSSETTIAGHTFTWSRGIIFNFTYATGADLITKYQSIYRAGGLLSDGVVTGDGVITGDLALISGGVITGDQILVSIGVITGDGLPFLHVSTLFSGLLEDGTFLSDGVITGDALITRDGVITGDLVMQAQSATLKGDETSAMPVEVDDGNDCLDY